MRSGKTLLFTLALCVSTFSQVLNTGQTIKLGTFSLTAAPLAFVNTWDRSPDPGFYTMFGIGLPAGLDLGFSARFGSDRSPLLGIDLEWGILRGFPSFSITTGFHGYRYAGIDATANLTFPVRNAAAIYGGVDSDFDFIHNDMRIPVWGFGGAEITVKRVFRILMELNIGLTAPARHILAAGIVLFF